MYAVEDAVLPGTYVETKKVFLPDETRIPGCLFTFAPGTIMSTQYGEATVVKIAAFFGIVKSGGIELTLMIQVERV